jgi:hypothetical protein
MSLMTETRRRRVKRFVAVAAAVAALPATPALASTNQQSIVEDEHQMLELGPGTQARALDDAVSLGADIVRVNVIWSRYAPKPKNKKRPKKFNGSDPRKYSQKKFAMLDSLVAGAQQRGLKVLLTPTGPIPAWASRCGGSVKKRSTCKPSSTEYGRFVRALGKRYPTVTMWSIWNEPNLRAWLSPQYQPKGTRPVLRSASLYRSLARSAIAALRSTGHKKHTILLGETAPIGNDVKTCRIGSSRARRACAGRLNSQPEDFLRAVFCIKTNGHRLTGSARREQGCSGRYSRLRVTGEAHHPYTRGGSRPPLSRPNGHEITIGVFKRLTRLLDQAGKAGRIPRKLPVWYTENGWQTNPPDRIFGVSLLQQAEYVNQSDWIAYKSKRIKAVAQYKLVDDVPQGSFQSGLRLADGTAKPAYAAYRLPIWVSGTGAQATLYGQVRPAADGAALSVDVQRAARPGAAFQTVQTVAVSSRKGQFKVPVANQGGVWRLRWNGLVSREAEVAPR